jgi:hypothetical protein
MANADETRRRLEEALVGVQGWSATDLRVVVDGVSYTNLDVSVLDEWVRFQLQTASQGGADPVTTVLGILLVGYYLGLQDGRARTR